VHVVQVDGAFDMHAAPLVKETFTRVMGEGNRQLVVDLCAATFIDSTAIGVLIGVMKKLRRGTTGRLSVACTNLNVIATFEMAGLDGALPIRLSIEDAVVAQEFATAR
jgi:anti-sigma B factor antagonist